MSLTLVLISTLTILGLGSFWAWWKEKRSSNAPAELKGKVLAIRVPKENEKGALAAEQMFASLHGLLKLTPEVQEHITFEITASPAGIFFYTQVPEHLVNFVSSQIFAQYPDADIREVEDYTLKLDELGRSLCGTQMVLVREHYFPIKTFPDFKVDPLAAITGALSGVGEGSEVWVQLLVRPLPDVWQEGGYQYIEAVRAGVGGVEISLGGLIKAVSGAFTSVLAGMPKMIFTPGREDEVDVGKKSGVQLTPAQQTEIGAIEEKVSRMGFETGIRILTISETPERARSLLRSAVASFKQFSTANLNSFSPGPVVENANELLDCFRGRHFPDDWSYVLNTEELASVFHLPNVSVETPTIAWSSYKKGEPPLNLPTEGEGLVVIAKTTFRDRLAAFGIKPEDRSRHFYVIGKTGTGKTTLFENMIIQDMRQGAGVGVIDPHGELIERLLDYVPEARIDDVVLFNPADKEFPVGFNMLELKDSSQKSLVASGLVDVFRNRFTFSWGPRLEHLIRNCILTLLEVPRTTLLGVTRLLQDGNYRNYIVHQIEDPVIRAFWEEEFKGMLGNQRLVTEAIAPIQNRLGQFLSSPVVRNIVGQPRSSFDLEETMNGGKIFFANLSKGRLGSDDSNILGSMLVTRLQFEAMRRVRVPEEERHNFYLYVDEFQNFAATGSFASILSEARKYHLCLHLTHQYVAQLPEEVRDAVFGNVGTIVSFGLGAPDARVMASEFAPYFTEEDIISLDAYNVYLELMIDGMSSVPFSAVTFPRLEVSPGKGAEVIRRSREKYGREREKIKAAIGKWAETRFDLGMAKAEEAEGQINPKSQ